MRVDTVVPRGGLDGASVVVTGTGFGVTPGTITFDPLGENGGPYVVATIGLWQDDRIEYTAPSGFSLSDRDNRFYRVHVERASGGQADTHPWWVPDSTLAPIALPPSDKDLDYQWPAFEAGSLAQEEDDPRKWQAADFNRQFDRTLKLESTVAVPLPTLQSVLAEGDRTGGNSIFVDNGDAIAFGSLAGDVFVTRQAAGILQIGATTGTATGALATRRIIVGVAGSGEVTCPGAGVQSEQIGGGATAPGNRATAVGYLADAPGASSFAAARGAQAMDFAAIALGAGSIASQNSGIAIGESALITHAQSIGLSRDATSTASGQFILGARSAPITTVYFGTGVTSNLVRNLRIQGTRVTTTETNESGTTVTFASGEGTGDSPGSILILQTPTPVGAGTTQQILTTRASFGASAIIIGSADDEDITVGSGSGKLGLYGAAPVVRAAAYTITNALSDRGYDADLTTLGELADVLGTLIVDLQAVGLIG